MYFEFYIDQFAVEHFLSEYLLLALTARVLGRRISAKRLAAAGAAGTAAMTAAICLGAPGWYAAGMLAAGTAAFFRPPPGGGPKTGQDDGGAGGEAGVQPAGDIRSACRTAETHNRKKSDKGRAEAVRRNFSEWGRAMAALLAVTVCFGGALEALTEVFGLPVPAGAAAAVLLVGAALEHRKKSRARTEHLVTVELCLGERTRQLRALFDTGNQLREPLTGRPVSIVQSAEAEALLEEGWEERRGYLLIPYHSLGSGKRWMRGVKLDRMRILCADGSRSVEGPILALYEQKLGGGEEYQMILHPEHMPAEASDAPI